MDGSRRPIPSADVFFQHGWDFDQVVVVILEDDMNRIPLGPSL